MRETQQAASHVGSQEEAAPWIYPLCRLVIVLAVVVSFGRLASAEFVGWDDSFNLYSNPRLNPPTWASVAYYWGHQAFGLYIPLTYTVWAGLAALTNGAPDTQGISMNPWVFHGFNVLLHVLSALVVLAILGRFVRCMPALFGALLFALHPVQVEAVGWAAGTKDVLSGLLVLVALWQYIDFARARRSESAPPGRMENARKQNSHEPPLSARAHYILALTALLLALLAKPSAMVTPALAFAIDFWLLGRPIRRIATALAPWLLLSLVCAIVARLVQDTYGITPAPAWARPFVAGDALAFYLYQLVWPISLTVDYGRLPTAMVGKWWFYLTWLAPAAIALLLWLNRRRWPEPFVGGVIFLLALSPVLGIFTFQFQYVSTVADHYLYAAMLGPALAGAWIVDCATRRFGAVLVRSICIAILLALSVRCIWQAGVWQSNATFFRHLLRANDRSFVGLNGLGHVHTLQNDLTGAEALFNQSLELKPDYWLAHENLAYVLEIQGRLDEAIEHHTAALAVMRRQDSGLEEHIPKVAAALARDLAILGRYDEARQSIGLALEYRPNDPMLLSVAQEIERRAAAGSTRRSDPP